MDNNPGKDRDEIMEDFADDLLSKEANSSHYRQAPGEKSHGKAIILWALGILILIGVFSFLFGGGNELSKQELASIFTRLSQLEKKTEKLEGVGGKIAQLEKEDKELEKDGIKRSKSITYLRSQIDGLNKKIAGLEKGIPSKRSATKPAGITKKPQTLQAKLGYHEVRAGDSLYGIAQKYGITVDELCRINNITKKQVIQPGQRLKVVLPE